MSPILVWDRDDIITVHWPHEPQQSIKGETLTSKNEARIVKAGIIKQSCETKKTKKDKKEERRKKEMKGRNKTRTMRKREIELFCLPV
jgi:hypothetical protein